MPKPGEIPSTEQPQLGLQGVPEKPVLGVWLQRHHPHNQKNTWQIPWEHPGFASQGKLERKERGSNRSYIGSTAQIDTLRPARSMGTTSDVAKKTTWKSLAACSESSDPPIPGFH
jgi:hypothetical protein